MGIEEYKQANSMSDDRFELIKKMYEKIILNLKYLKKYANYKKPDGILTAEQRTKVNEVINNRIIKINEVVDIIELLKTSLDMETPEYKESSQYLYGLYEYQLLTIYKLMVNMEESEVSKTINVFEETLLAWEESVVGAKNGK